MHIPDGFLSPPVWASLDAISIPAVGWLARRVSRSSDLAADQRKIPLLGVMGAFVFAAQMINFPVAAGTSSHLIGGTLLALVVGPAAAAIVMTAILLLQALLFQDGGLLVLGANIFNMALCGVAAGSLPFLLFGRSRATVFLGGFLSVAISASLAVSQLLLSGIAISRPVLWGAAGVFLVSAILEGAITVAAMEAIERIAPEAMAASTRHRRGIGLLLAPALGLIVAGTWIASSHPDSIESLAGQIGLASQAAFFQSPLAGYSLPWFSTAGGRAIAGMVGLGATFAICFGLGRLLIRRSVPATRHEPERATRRAA